MLQVSQGTVSRWETASVPLDLAQLSRICRALRVRPWVLLAIATSDNPRAVAPGVVDVVESLVAPARGRTWS